MRGRVCGIRIRMGSRRYTELLTGQEKREVPFATHVSCTVEMASTDRRVLECAYAFPTWATIRCMQTRMRGADTWTLRSWMRYR